MNGGFCRFKNYCGKRSSCELAMLDMSSFLSHKKLFWGHQWVEDPKSHSNIIQNHIKYIQKVIQKHFWADFLGRYGTEKNSVLQASESSLVQQAPLTETSHEPFERQICCVGKLAGPMYGKFGSLDMCCKQTSKLHGIHCMFISRISIKKYEDMFFSIFHLVFFSTKIFQMGFSTDIFHHQKVMFSGPGSHDSAIRTDGLVGKGF